MRHREQLGGPDKGWLPLARPRPDARRQGVRLPQPSLIGDCTQDGGRRPPLLPSAFAAELESKSFTNGKDDKPLVKRLYEAAFKERFGKATVLDYGMLGWGDADAAQLAEVLASGAAPRLERLQLFGNKIGDEGCKALAAALGKEGAAPRLKELYLNRNKINDEGCKALAAALKEGAAPSLKARDAPPRCSPRPRPMLIAPPLACRRSSWTTRSSLSWWPCARSAVSSCAEPLQPRPGWGVCVGGGLRLSSRARTSTSPRPAQSAIGRIFLSITRSVNSVWVPVLHV